MWEYLYTSAASRKNNLHMHIADLRVTENKSEKYSSLGEFSDRGPKDLSYDLTIIRFCVPKPPQKISATSIISFC